MPKIRPRKIPKFVLRWPLAISLPRGEFVIIDRRDYHKLAKYLWHRTKAGYVVRTRKKSDGPGPKAIYLHLVVFGRSASRCVDHRDRNKLNCRRSNLRPASGSESGCNIAKRVNQVCTSKFKGVSFDPSRRGKKCWVAQLTKNGNRVLMERFHTEREAALAYNVAARKYHGPFAFLNAIT